MPFDPYASPHEQEQKPLAPGDRWILIGFCVLLFGGLLAELLRDFTPVRLSIVFFPLAWGVLTAVHEAGHALAARVCGWRVNAVVVGFGRLLVRTEVRGVPVELRSIPLIGYAAIIPEGASPGQTARLRLSNAFVYFAGPGIELLVVAGLVLVLGWETMTTRADSVAVVAAQSVAVAALVGAILNLIPHTGPDGSWSDGMGLVMSPFLTEGHFEQRMAAPLVAQAQARVDAGDPSGAMVIVDAAIDQYPRAVGLHLTAAYLLVQLGRRGEALLRLQALGRDGRFSRAERRTIEQALEAVRQSRW